MVFIENAKQFNLKAHNLEVEDQGNEHQMKKFLKAYVSLSTIIYFM